ncbi:hypothetical protein L195_g020715 [Trifolium pratense]|uniref:Uncharacterized protein n=1 Tax=Trifolium pratense TaxID=57577 RepID=A0A2K3N387_TRIPR|nr:hypothetical protein L195_g020715 [Trifolium pratense]
MGLKLSFLSPLEFGMSLGKPELYGFGFGDGKTRPHLAPLPCLERKQRWRSQLAHVGSDEDEYAIHYRWRSHND